MKPRMVRFFLGRSSFTQTGYEAFRGPQTDNGACQWRTVYPTSLIERRYSVVTGSDDRKVKVVAIETGQVIFDTAFHDGWVRTVVFGSEFFFSGSDDRQVTHPLVPLFSNKLLFVRSTMVIGL